jgi:hypothetical protein
MFFISSIFMDDVGFKLIEWDESTRIIHHPFSSKWMNDALQWMNHTPLMDEFHVCIMSKCNNINFDEWPNNIKFLPFVEYDLKYYFIHEFHWINGWMPIIKFCKWNKVFPNFSFRIPYNPWSGNQFPNLLQQLQFFKNPWMNIDEVQFDEFRMDEL